MKINILFAIIFTLAFFSPFTANAQLAGNPENWCRNGFFPREKVDFYIGKIKAKRHERVYFYGDERNCPTGKNCRQKSFLLAGNEVLASRKFGDFSCVWFQPEKGAETVGWIPTNKIEGQSFLTERYKPWLGEWKFYGNSLKITAGEKEGVFYVKGNAFWKGSRSNIHVGEIETKATLGEDSILNLKDDDCEIRLDLVVYYLVVSDNLKCGGANVTFSGVYIKK